MSILGAAGAGLRTWAAAYLRPEVMRDHRLHDERLTADGPFRHVRNPLYLGNILMAAGMGLSASRAGAVALVAFMTPFGGRLILREEAALEAAQGED
jgi:protein-S-isoprenylcysteine O-methyltransferase Ste14